MKGLKVFEDHITSNTKTEQTKDAEHRKTKSLFLKSIVKKSVLIRIGLEIETKIHFFLHCPLFQSARQSLLMNIKKTGESILKKHGEFITKTLLYGDDKFGLSCNKSTIFSTIEFIVSTERFSNSLV